MRFAVYHSNDRRGLAVDLGAGFSGLFQDETGYPGDLERLIGSHADLTLTARALARGTAIDPEAVQLLPPLPNPGKIICIGLNYVDHSAEVGIALPDYPTVFARFSSSLIGHAAPVAVPRQSIQFDYEGELVAVIGHGGRNNSRGQALDHVAGYSIFNDISVRDYQFRTPQWTMGKNFDGTGVFGPTFVTADALVFSARPGRIRTIRTVNLPSPRDVFRIRFTEAFAHLNEELWDELKDEVARGTDV